MSTYSIAHMSFLKSSTLFFTLQSFMFSAILLVTCLINKVRIAIVSITCSVFAPGRYKANNCDNCFITFISTPLRHFYFRNILFAFPLLACFSARSCFTSRVTAEVLSACHPPPNERYNSTFALNCSLVIAANSSSLCNALL
jgi:hypothetical protein